MSADPDQLTRQRGELQAKLENLAKKVAGSGHPDAAGIEVEVRAPVAMRELEGAKPIPRTHDTVARIRVNDPDPERAARMARAVSQTLETEWAEQEIGEPRVVIEPDAAEFDALFTLSRTASDQSA